MTTAPNAVPTPDGLRDRMLGLCYEHFADNEEHLGRCYLEADVLDLLAWAERKGAAGELRSLADVIDPGGHGWTSVHNAKRFADRLRDRADRIVARADEATRGPR